MADKTRFTELLAKEPDPLRRMALIGFNMDALRDPEEALIGYRTPEGYYEKWAEAHYSSLITRTAQRTGIDPAILADKDRRTPEQTREILETSAQEQFARLEIYLASNYAAAIKHICAYCTERAEAQGTEDIYKPLGEVAPNEANLSGELVNVPLSAALYFFATHETIDPRRPDALTADDKAELTRIFDDLDAFYRKNRGDLKSEQGLLSAYLDSLNPKDPEATKETLEQISAKRASVVEYPLDKVNSKIWNILEEATGGQVKYYVDVAKKNSRRETTILYAVDFDGLEDVKITKRLTAYDKRVYVAASALFNAGNHIITLTQIYYAMGYTGRPGRKDLERINAAITKMSSAKIYINNEHEAEVYHYDKFVYDGALLPMERTTVISNGRATDAAIHLFREPPIITFAKQRKQITTLEIKLLQSRVNKTDRNLLIDDYLLEQISRAKREKKHAQRLLFGTIFKRTNIKGAKNQDRALETIQRYLAHYQECDYITRFTLDADGVTVYFTKR